MICIHAIINTLDLKKQDPEQDSTVGMKKLYQFNKILVRQYICISKHQFFDNFLFFHNLGSFLFFDDFDSFLLLFKSIERNPLVDHHLTFVDSFLEVGKDQLILHIYEDIAPTRFPKQQLIQNPCVLGPDDVIVIPFIFACPELVQSYHPFREMVELFHLDFVLIVQKLKSQSYSLLLVLNLPISVG